MALKKGKHLLQVSSLNLTSGIRPPLSKKPFLSCTGRGLLHVSRPRPPAGSLIFSVSNPAEDSVFFQSVTEEAKGPNDDLRTERQHDEHLPSEICTGCIHIVHLRLYYIQLNHTEMWDPLCVLGECVCVWGGSKVDLSSGFKYRMNLINHMLRD